MCHLEKFVFLDINKLLTRRKLNKPALIYIPSSQEITRFLHKINNFKFCTKTFITNPSKLCPFQGTEVPTYYKL